MGCRYRRECVWPADPQQTQYRSLCAAPRRWTRRGRLAQAHEEPAWQGRLQAAQHGRMHQRPIPAMEPAPVRRARSPQGPSRAEHVRSRQQHPARPPSHPRHRMTKPCGFPPRGPGSILNLSPSSPKAYSFTDSEERALARVSKDGGRLRTLRPSFETLAEFIIGPRYARTRWQAPQDEVGDIFTNLFAGTTREILEF